MPQTDMPETICLNPDRAHLLSLDHLLDFVPRSARRVLDCTGEWGGRGHRLKSRGAQEVVGLVDLTAGAPGPDEGYDDTIQGPLDFVTLPPRGDGFDCILCTASLERLRNPEAFIRPLISLLAPGALFLAVVPNMQYHKIVCTLTEGRWIYGDSGVWDRKNLRFYTAHEIRWLLNQAGISRCKLACLVKDEDSAFPRDAEGMARSGRLRIGPLDDDTYQAWLTEYYLVLAVQPGA